MIKPARTYQGVVFDNIDEVIIARAPVVVSSYAEALQQAAELCIYINSNPREFKNYKACQETDCYVLRDGHLMLTENLQY